MWSSAQCFPHHHTVSSRMTGPCLFCFFLSHYCTPNSGMALDTLHCRYPKISFWMNAQIKTCMHMEETRWLGIRWVILKTSRSMTRLQKEMRSICHNKWGEWMMVGRWVMTRGRKWYKPQRAELFPWHWRSTVPEVTVRRDEDISSTSKFGGTWELEEWATIACRLEGKPCLSPRETGISEHSI